MGCWSGVSEAGLWLLEHVFVSGMKQQCAGVGAGAFHNVV